MFPKWILAGIFFLTAFIGGVRRDVHLKDLWLHITNELQKMTFKNVFCKTKLFEMQVQKLSEIQALSFDHDTSASAQNQLHPHKPLCGYPLRPPLPPEPSCLHSAPERSQTSKASMNTEESIVDVDVQWVVF